MNIFQQKINKRKLENNYRTLYTLPDDYIDFQSNDYLGFARNKEIHKLWLEKNQTFISNGSTGSRLISGNSDYYNYLEHLLSQLYQSENSLLFPSGFMANLAVFSTIPQKNDIVFYDEYIHASVREGLRLSFAKHFSFKHNDYKELEQKLQSFSGSIYVVIEGLYSMDGDVPEIDKLQYLINKFKFKLIVDEAHSTGILGENGKGWYENFKGNIFIRIHTFGKTMGIHGAVVACSNEIKKYMINFSKPLIYSTAMSFSELSKIDVVHEYYIKNGLLERRALFKNINYFSSLFRFKENNQSPIFIFSHPKIEEIAKQIIYNKMAVKLIKNPTVAKGKERIRCCIHSFNRKAEIEKLYSIYKEYL